MISERKYQFYKKTGHFHTDKVKEVIPCKNCGEKPILHKKQNESGVIENCFFCSCKRENSYIYTDDFKMAIEFWNGKNKIAFPTCKEFNMLNYVGIAMNPKTFLRFTRWDKGNITIGNSYSYVTDTNNGLSVFLNKDIEEDVIKLLNKSDMKNVVAAEQPEETVEG